MSYDLTEVYVTSVESEAYTLARELTLAGIPCRVAHRTVWTTLEPYYVTIIRDVTYATVARKIRENVLKTFTT